MGREEGTEGERGENGNGNAVSGEMRKGGWRERDGEGGMEREGWRGRDGEREGERGGRDRGHTTSQHY